MKYLVPMLAAFTLGFAVSTASAQGPRPAIGLHVAPIGADIGKACTTGPTTCAGVVTTGPTVPAGGGPAYWVYVVALPLSVDNGVSGVSFGIFYEWNAETYAGAYLESNGFVNCADLGFFSASWPQPFSGATLTFAPAQCDASIGKDLAVCGVFQVALYSASLMQIVANQNGQFGVAKCGTPAQTNLQFPSAAGWVSLGGAQSSGDSEGCNPCFESCASVAASRSTWGKIKKTFEGSGE